MPRTVITNWGKGADTTTNPSRLSSGFCRQFQNVLPTNTESGRLRGGIDRIYATRTSSSPLLGLFEFVSGTESQETRLCKVNGSLESFTLTPSDAKSTIDTGFDTTGIGRFEQALGFWLLADNRSANWIGNSTNAYPLQTAAPTATLTATASAGAGLTAGTYTYSYARFSSITGEISPALATGVTVAVSGGNLRASLQIASLSTTEQFDRVKFFRTASGGTVLFEHPVHSSVSIATVNTGFVDSTGDASLLTESTIHTSAGATKTSKPEAASDVVFHRGRVFLIGLDGLRSRMRWSQLNALEFDSTTDARHDVDADDGDYLVRAISTDSTLVLFKEKSIHVQNGDVDEAQFTWQCESPKSAAIGAWAPHTVTATPYGIFFLSGCGVYVYRPGVKPQRVSDAIQATLEDLEKSRKDLFCAEWDPCNELYLLSVTPSGGSANTLTLAFDPETGAWSFFYFGSGLIAPSVWAKMTNGENEFKPFFGSSNGWVYEYDQGTDDGVTSGTVAGTATSGSSTNITDSGAAFRTTGQGLLDIPATVVKSGPAWETKLVTVNTATALTTASFSSAPTAGDVYYVGAIDGIIELGRLNMGTSNVKYVERLTFQIQAQSSSVPLAVGFTLDADSSPTSITSFSQSGIFRASINVQRYCIGVSPYLRIVGSGGGMELLQIEIDYRVCGTRLPSSR